MHNSIVFREDFLTPSPPPPVHLKLTKEEPFTMMHHHDFVEIAYVYEGEVLIRLGTNVFWFPKATCLSSPGVSHVFQPLDLKEQAPLYLSSGVTNFATYSNKCYINRRLMLRLI
ncbi:hypothetical protein ABIE27_005543 [Paenibacillus sp. 4624]